MKLTCVKMKRGINGLKADDEMVNGMLGSAKLLVKVSVFNSYVTFCIPRCT